MAKKTLERKTSKEYEKFTSKRGKTKQEYSSEQNSESYLHLRISNQEIPIQGLKKREKESLMDYQKRLNTYCAGTIGLVESYEKAANIERFKILLPLTKKLLEIENKEATKEVLELINNLNKEIQWYESNYNSLSDKKEIKEKKKGLNSLLS